MKLFLPIAGNVSRGAWYGLVRRVPTRRRQLLGAVDERIRSKTVKPLFTRFEARDDRVFRVMKVFSSVLVRRAVATPDMPARRTAAKVQPPATAGETVGASRPAGLRARDDFLVILCH